MAKDLLINGVSYNGVESLSIPTKGGDTASFVDVDELDVIPHPVLSDDLIPTAIDTDGSIYNGTGFMEGYRISSSGNVSASSSFGHTGYIPFKRDEVIYMKPKVGTQRLVPPEYTHLYDKNFNHVGYVVSQQPSDGICVLVDRTICEKPVWWTADGKKLDDTAYIRLSGNVSYGRYTLHKAAE